MIKKTIKCNNVECGAEEHLRITTQEVPLLRCEKCKAAMHIKVAA